MQVGRGDRADALAGKLRRLRPTGKYLGKYGVHDPNELWLDSRTGRPTPSCERWPAEVRDDMSFQGYRRSRSKRKSVK